jgi:Domain of unknown function (DUF4282)
MSDSSQGPGWWQASDGKWYPPEQQSGALPPPPSPGSGPLPGPGPLPGGQPGSSPSPTDGPFLNRLFDLSFGQFITPSIIKLLFILAIALVSLTALFFLIGGLAQIDDGGIFFVILAPICWLFGVIYARVLLELVIVFFRIERNTRPKP